MYTKGKIILTPLNEEDLPVLHKWINNKELVNFNSYYKPVSWESHLNWFKTITSNTNMVIFGIRLANDNKLIGTGQLHSIHPVYRSAELQIRIGDTHEHSKGYGTDAIKLLIQYGFNDLNLNRIYLGVFVDNIRAIKAYEKVGFIKEGLQRMSGYINGKYKDVVMMSILKKEFSKFNEK